MSIRTGIESFARDRGTTTALMIGLITFYAPDIDGPYKLARLIGLIVAMLVVLRMTNKHREATGNYPKMQDLSKEIEANMKAETERMREQADRLELERLKAELREKQEDG